MQTEHFVAMDLGERQTGKPPNAGKALFGLCFEDLTVGHRAVAMRTVMETDLNDFAAVNAVYARFMPEPPPARSTVQAAALPKGGLVEIEVIARRSPGR